MQQPTSWPNRSSIQNPPEDTAQPTDACNLQPEDATQSLHLDPERHLTRVAHADADSFTSARLLGTKLGYSTRYRDCYIVFYTFFTAEFDINWGNWGQYSVLFPSSSWFKLQMRVINENKLDVRIENNSWQCLEQFRGNRIPTYSSVERTPAESSQVSDLTIGMVLCDVVCWHVPPGFARVIYLICVNYLWIDMTMIWYAYVMICERYDNSYGMMCSIICLK